MRDIITAIDLILTWIEEAGGAEEAMLRNPLVRSGVERQILVISEAANRLYGVDPLIAPKLAPDIDWAGIRGIGNFIRHKYDDLDTAILVDVITNRLEPLRMAVERAMARIDVPKDDA
ncbi:MAG TPA: HepT-like ribonuclease domain-containing protein [Rhizomicrobium sp.]|nr:HepT-like ribonuclease domain-containing protein [Rhizomicrobium sp.]